MRDLTLVMAYFENPGQLTEQQNVWADYQPDLKRHFHVIVTDAFSPAHLRAKDVFHPVGLASQRLYLALQHRRWDWLMPRNLGVQESTTKWLLMTDMDHVLPSQTLRHLLEMDLDETAVYRFSRVDAHGLYPWPSGSLTPFKPHPNTWLMTRAMFEQIGGFDERFANFYGSDSEHRERVHANASSVIMLPDPMVRYPREIIPDASTTSHERKTFEDGQNIPRIKAERAQIKGWRPLRVTIPWRLEMAC
jgi:hypothetical protein